VDDGEGGRLRIAGAILMVYAKAGSDEHAAAGEDFVAAADQPGGVGGLAGEAGPPQPAVRLVAEQD
jgi:hypothetical protein